MRNLLAAVLTAAAFSAGADSADPLAESRWRHRVLLLYVPAADAPALDRFRAALRARQCGVADRDLVPAEIIGTDRATLAGGPPSAARARALRRLHGIDPERVMTVLVGRDGGVKMRVEGVAGLDDVFARIDAMPMRRREMGGRGDPCR